MPLTPTEQFLMRFAKGGWPVFLIYLAIVGAQFAIDYVRGPAWAFVTAVILLGVWLLNSPWRLGELSPGGRWTVCILGTFGLFFLVLIYASKSWSHARI